MNYIYNGEIRCKKKDLEKVMPLVQNIFSHPDVEELNDDCQIVISDEIRGDITEEMDNFCQALEKNGLSVSGEISYTGDYKGRYIFLERNTQNFPQNSVSSGTLRYRILLLN